jgi:hypothetical protein
MKKILKISKMSKEYFNLPLEEYILTFEDNLLEIFSFLRQLENLKTEKIVFVTTSKIERDKGALTIPQLLDLKYSNFEIGGNWHNYLDYRQNQDNIVNILIKLKKDSEKMQTFFSKKLRIRPTKFCFPFDHEIWGYRRILINLGYTDFYGEGRIDIDTLNF